MSDDIARYMRAEMDSMVDQLSPGMVLAAKKLKRYYEILSAMELPEPIILAEITAWCQGESRLSTESMLHRLYMQQRAPRDTPAEPT